MVSLTQEARGWGTSRPHGATCYRRKPPGRLTPCALRPARNHLLGCGTTWHAKPLPHSVAWGGGDCHGANTPGPLSGRGHLSGAQDGARGGTLCLRLNSVLNGRISACRRCLVNSHPLGHFLFIKLARCYANLAETGDG